MLGIMEGERNKRFKEIVDREGKEGRVDKGEGERGKERVGGVAERRGGEMTGGNRGR